MYNKFAIVFALCLTCIAGMAQTRKQAAAAQSRIEALKAEARKKVQANVKPAQVMVDKIFSFAERRNTKPVSNSWA